MKNKILDKLWLLKASKFADKVLKRKDFYKNMSQDALISEVSHLKDIVQSKNNLDAVLIDAFALASVACYNKTGLDLYKVQIMGALALHEGSIAELKTGEGKSILVVLPAFLHALEGKGVHVVTVNPYLTARDRYEVGCVFEYLGLSVGMVLPEMSGVVRKSAYACDITYISNTELGFDYLRDNMAMNKDMACQRGLHYAIIDEVDSILIDEAKTPLIIAGQPKDVSKICMAVDVVVRNFKRGAESSKFNRADAMLGVKREESGDVIVHEKEQNVFLTAQGVSKIEKAFGLENYGDVKNFEIQHYVEQSLRAHFLMRKDKDYVVKDNKIQIVDEFTGRIMNGRSYSDGLHQAIECKEHVDVSPINITVATTTYQNFFRKYNKISGMTGTAYTDSPEFKKTYGLKVRVIPTNKPIKRKDEDDVLYLNKADKWSRVVEEVKLAVERKQPVLVGTSSVKDSEHISKLLTEQNIKHEVLNAHQDEREAEIISNCGKAGSVTVATNMAGRGTDIKLDEQSLFAGGLYVIGTEKHESKRIDNQLRGRSGRQGDDGKSIFILSAEDRVMRLYGSDIFAKQLKGTTFDNGKPIKLKSVLRAIKSTQNQVELDNFATRQSTLEYDDIDDIQREDIYGYRRKLLNNQDVSKEIESVVDWFVNELFLKSNTELAYDILGEVEGGVSKRWINKRTISKANLKQYLLNTLDTSNPNNSIYRRHLLLAIDSAWAEHLLALEYLRDAVSYVGYSGKDPKAIYANEAYELYERTIKLIYHISCKLMFDKVKDKYDKNGFVDGIKIRKG